jgi:MYXO-CTERM domain-containing protein
MKTSRICAGVVATLALFASDYAQAEPGAAGETVVLQTYSKVWVAGDALGPVQNGAPRLGKLTGAGVMDAHFAFDATDPASILLATTYTRSAATKNQNTNNDSYLQGAVAFATLTEKGVTPGKVVDLPTMTGERAYNRPNVNIVRGGKVAILDFASEDNGINNNPMISTILVDTVTGAVITPANPTRQGNKAFIFNVVDAGNKQFGLNIPNPNNQRGPHSCVNAGPDSVICGNQYNNQAAEAYKLTVSADNKITVNFFKRYSNTAQHCRPQVAIQSATATEFYTTEVEANNQPAEIGIRLTKASTATGNVISSKIVVRSDPKGNKYVAEPSAAFLGDKLALGYQLSASVNRNQNGDNGHAGGAQTSLVGLFSTTSLEAVGAPLMNAAPYGRHSTMFGTTYGPNAEPAVAYIGGSSTGTKGAFEQLIPLKADGTLGLKDSAKLYAVSAYSDVANVQARGLRNPNNQARGFINGLGGVPNPGFGKTATGFMPEVKSFSFSTITGYTDAAGATIGKRNSLWLSLVPASWAPGIATTPGSPTDKPGSNPDGTGPSPRTTAPGTNPSGDAQSDDGKNVLGGTDPTNPDNDGSRAALGADNGSCSVSSTGSSSSSGAGLMLLAVAGVILVLRRKNEGV